MKDPIKSSNAIRIIDLIKCNYELKPDTNYLEVYPCPATGKLYVTPRSPHFISGHIRMRGKKGGKYPYKYSEMLDNIFGRENNTIEVCSGSVRGRENGESSSGTCKLYS